jgi:hypothetical protein
MRILGSSDWRIFYGCLILAGISPRSFAGMTVYDLNDVVRLRLEELSFFSVVLALCGLAIRALWNWVAKDFKNWPRLTYGKALALTGLLSLLMLLVLSMISGARELMTPGAWNRQGSAYRLRTEANAEQRRIGMEGLRSAIFAYAREHGGRFPPHDFVPEIPERIWAAPDLQGTRYIYLAGFDTNATTNIIACEPQNFGDLRNVLFGNGEIKQLSGEALKKILRGDR